MSERKYTNRLKNEKSPYLMQHAHNPVDWYPWGDEAFEKAKKEDKPIFLSIGYSTCHWCHVMERESFEDSEVAEILNNHFISIKVDREERPDVDHIYMNVCQALTGHGGWPLTIFMTPDKKPFYAGTYYPKNDRMGMMGITSLLKRVADAWGDSRASIYESSEEIISVISRENFPLEEINKEKIMHNAYSEFKHNFDSIYGGFGNAPKFPSPHNLLFLLRYWYVYKENFALNMVEKTLDSMHRGGIFDHIGFGFSRYSTDRKWLVPHFEKMLYDNALLAIAYLETYQATKHERYAEVARQILTYISRDMTSPEGGFYCAEDADSEGVEGKFYVWKVDEIKQVLGNNGGDRYCSLFDITSKGNFEGLSIPNLIRNQVSTDNKEFVENCRQKLFEYREKRIHPYKDDKILSSWNGLMIATMSIAGRVLNEDKYTKYAETAVKFILSKLIRDDGRLMARYRDDDAAIPGYIDDYAFLIWGLIELYESNFNPEYIKKAINLSEKAIELFWDQANGGFFLNGKDSEQLLTRPKEVYDGAMPSGNSVAALCYLKLARLTGRNEFEETADKLFKTFSSQIGQFPTGYTFLLTALMLSTNKSNEVILVKSQSSNESDEMINAVRERFNPFTSLIYYTEGDNELKKIIPFIGDYKSINDKTTAYVCENYSCKAPTSSVEQLRELLQ